MPPLGSGDSKELLSQAAYALGLLAFALFFSATGVGLGLAGRMLGVGAALPVGYGQHVEHVGQHVYRRVVRSTDDGLEEGAVRAQVFDDDPGPAKAQRAPPEVEQIEVLVEEVRFQLAVVAVDQRDEREEFPAPTPSNNASMNSV